MATITGTAVVQAEAALDPTTPGQEILRVVWSGRNPTTGTTYEAVTYITIPDPSVQLVQADWDTAFATAAASLATQSGISGPTVNPVVI